MKPPTDDSSPEYVTQYWEWRLTSEGLGMRAGFRNKQVRPPRAQGDRRGAIARELPMDLDIEYAHGQPLWGQPETWIEAAMSHHPHLEQPRLSKEELKPLRETLLDAMDALPEPERTLMHAVASGSSIREAGELVGMPYSTAYGRIREAKQQLRATLKQHPEVVPYLKDDHDF